jgi:plastocyanin
MAETTYILTEETPDLQGINTYSTEDTNLVDQYTINSEFNPDTDLIELYVYSQDDTLLQLIGNYTGYKELGNSASAGKDGTSVLYIDPIQDSQTLGYTQGGVQLLYNFLRNISDVSLYVSEISPDRTELKARTLEEVPSLLAAVRELQSRLSTVPYFNEFRLNFLNGTLLIGVNIDIDTDGSILIKLYEPLPVEILTKTNFRLVELVSDSINYSVEAVTEPAAETFPTLRGPNFTSDLDGQSVQPTEFLNYNELYLYPVTSSYYKLLNQVSQSGAEINIDYTDYTNFVHFSSAQERLDNFTYKIGLIQTYESASASIKSQFNTSASLATSGSTVYYENLIKGIVGKFDGYENYLYFESSSFTWPKTTSIRPYTNAAVSSVAATGWYASQSLSASLYDQLNQSSLVYTVPEFIRQDSANAPYSLFLNMLGQHFDNLWIYAKAVTDKYNADNRINYGVSKDLVGEVLKSFGVKLYNSNFSIANLNSLFLGEFYNSGSEQINTFVTASNQPTPDRDILAETYKRIYHNLPYLIKTKGTERGLRALINCFGIPSGSLQVKVYGGTNTLAPTPYYGSSLPTGSKVRLDNTGSIVAGSTLSYYTSIQKDDRKYTQDLNVVEVGFSPSYNIDNYISQSITSSFDLDQYIGDPRYIYQGSYESDTNGNLSKVAYNLLSGSAAYDVNDFVRLIKFFDNQLFKMVRDFVPARDVTTSGIIIKPHVLNRSKVKSAEPTGTRPEYSASIDTAFISASNGGVLSTYSTAFSQSILTPLGEVVKINNTEKERIDGELGGSVLDLYTGSLNQDNPLKGLNPPLLTYDTSGSNGNSPTQGALLWRYTTITNSIGQITGFGVGSVHIHQVSKTGENIQPALTNLSAGDTFTFTIIYDGIEGGSPCGLPITRTLTQTIQSIVYVGASIWRIQFTSNSIERLFSANTGFCDQGITYYNYTDSPVILNPYLATGNFFNSDYNALINNATTVANAANVQKVDYSSNPFVPVNIAAIRANTAERAEVQELLYTSPGLTSGRYTGQQLTGQQVNKYIVGDKSYGKNPVVESTTPYFCIFDYISGFSPEHNQANAVVLSYIVDEEGNLFTPDSPVALPILQQSFPAKSEFEISIQSPSIGGSEATLLGMHSVLRPAARLEPIIFSYTAATYLNPSYSIDSRLQFENDPNLLTYDMRASGTSQTITNLNVGQRTTLVAGTETKDDRGYYNTGTSTYTFAADSEQPVKFTGTFTFAGDGKPSSFGTIPGEADIKFIKSSDGSFNTSTITTLGSKRIVYQDLFNQTVTFSTPFAFGKANEAVRAVVDIVKETTDLSFSSKIISAASLESGSSFVSTATEGYFFATGSLTSTRTVLTGSVALSGKYEKYFTGISGSSSQGFNAVNLRFTVEPGDEIKFNNDENKTYLVIAVETPDQNTSGLLYVTLNGLINRTANKDFFAIRRYVNTSNMLLMNIDKVAGTQNTGILFPEYPSPRLKANYEKIISDLKNKGIL